MRRVERGEAGAETIGAVLLFGLFVAVIAFLNVTSVPAAGLRGEEEHVARVVDRLNLLQASAEAAAAPGAGGATASVGVPLAPERDAGQDFFSVFLAEPGRATGEIAIDPSYGNVTLRHFVTGSASAIEDVGSAASRLPIGRIAFDPHPVYRAAGIVALENGALLATDPDGATLRFDPPIAVSVSGSETSVVANVRIVNGTAAAVGGAHDVRLALRAEGATLVAPAAANAASVEYRLETAHGTAWGAFLNATSTDAGLTSPGGYATGVARGAGASGLDVVTWTVYGTGTGNDVRLAHGVAVFTATAS